MYNIFYLVQACRIIFYHLSLICVWLFAWADCMNEILFIFMRIAHKLHSYSYRYYFIIIRELLLYCVHFIIICEFNFILFNVQLYQV